MSNWTDAVQLREAALSLREVTVGRYICRPCRKMAVGCPEVGDVLICDGCGGVLEPTHGDERFDGDV